MNILRSFLYFCTVSISYALYGSAASTAEQEASEKAKSAIEFVYGGTTAPSLCNPAASNLTTLNYIGKQINAQVMALSKRIKQLSTAIEKASPAEKIKLIEQHRKATELRHKLIAGS